MAIDTRTFDEIASIVRNARLANTRALVLGDCTFFTSWRSGDNRADLASFGRLCGFSSVDSLDISGAPTIRADFYDEVPTERREAFDLIIDAGVLYWCFDVALAWRHILDMLKPNGIMIHQSALTGYMGRGFYSFQ